MAFWNYIGEFFLFHWMFGSHKHNETKRDVTDTTISSANSGIVDAMDSQIDFGSHYDNSYPLYANQNYGYSQS